MAKKKLDLDAMRRKMRKPKSVAEIEAAVSKIHETKKPVSKPKKPKPAATEKIPKPKPKKPESKTRINLNIPKSLHLKFKIYCLENETTITDEILKFIQSKI